MNSLHTKPTLRFSKTLPKNIKNLSFVDCNKKEICGSCELVNTNYKKSLQKKHLESLAILKQNFLDNEIRYLQPTPSPKTLNYRSTAKLAVRRTDREKRFLIGLFSPGSHKVVDIVGCPVHHISIDKILPILQQKLESSTLDPWDEKNQTGDIKYLVIRASHLTGKLMITFVCANQKSLIQLRKIVRALPSTVVSSTWANINRASGNAIMGDKMKHLSGSARLRDSLGDLDLFVSPGSFFQVNPWTASLIYRRIQDLLGCSTKKEVVWDLYCGIGITSMIAINNGFRVLAVEENPYAIEDLNINLKSNSIDSSSHKIVQAKVEDVLSSSTICPTWTANPSSIIVNPSRSGLEPKVIENLTKRLEGSCDHQIIYISCSLKTLIRDLKEFEQNKYKIKQIESYDMFAQTNKLEWLVVLTSK
jgi:23S rRNA (uracil1939-C5)-methyltransferase